MNLHQLKKQLKQELKSQETKKNKKIKSTRWLLLVVLCVLLVGGLYPVYRQRQLTTPQRLMNNAAEQESLGQTAAAEKIYRAIYQDHKDTEEAAEALFRIARLQQYDNRDTQQALLSYLQLEKDYPASQRLLAAQQESARIIKYSLRDYSQAIGYYQQLLEAQDGAEDQYIYEIADCYFRLENYTQARIELEILIEDFPESSLIADALYRKGGLLLLENRVDAAQESWSQLIELYPESSYRPQAEFNLAKLLEEEDLLVEALEQYQKLTDFPRPAMLQDKIEHLKQRIAAKKRAI
ncbi:MAG: tetratricopeptide repeat protein [Deltaproteobacteria bacterium]|jgi:TolA-binding protein|nr:tetratricopeptide repeat protein [Deltaproteobacteria bacterium]MCW9049982.1 tetratricopeptide repeat protein [Deltaproteobacteria bacterium]